MDKPTACFPSRPQATLTRPLCTATSPILASSTSIITISRALRMVGAQHQPRAFPTRPSSLGPSYLPSGLTMACHTHHSSRKSRDRKPPTMVALRISRPPASSFPMRRPLTNTSSSSTPRPRRPHHQPYKTSNSGSLRRSSEVKTHRPVHSLSSKATLAHR